MFNLLGKFYLIHGHKSCKLLEIDITLVLDCTGPGNRPIAFQVPLGKVQGEGCAIKKIVTETEPDSLAFPLNIYLIDVGDVVLFDVILI